ncbi:MAG: glucosamine-6-phosphate deaminase [Prevotellaceae bacterium]|jgi:glucosamine-6-phosphate deaminase|nr:glucosamine-6-phosphate deaminase [Prevotellaceae bacterium]
MKANLSSQIVLHRIPKKYYRPDDVLELSGISRFEKIETNISETSIEGSRLVAREIADLIRERQAAGKRCVLGLNSGRTPMEVYEHLVEIHRNEKLSFKNVVVFNLFEYYPLDATSAQSCLNQIRRMLFDHVDIAPEHIFSPDGAIPQNEIVKHCHAYEQKIADFGGIDYQILGVGPVGNIGFNEPGSQPNSGARLILLDAISRKEATRLFGTIDKVPAGAITLGIGSILKAKRVALLAWGDSKSPIIHSVVEGAVSDLIPASYMQTHSNITIFLDIHAASSLTRISHPWLVSSCEWNNRLIRRAIIWLCMKVNKPILKLTNKDYNENGLSELLALYGSAYNVNIKIFNDLQHTITGWPGGKPDADDTYRPERAKPYPKRVVVFSPHPDDDVISMGGTLQRLVDQQHEVHIAYQTSGNIAVDDDEVIRYIAFVKGFKDMFCPDNDIIEAKYQEIKQFLLQDKKENDIDTLDVRMLKGLIRRGEAKAADRYMNVRLRNIHFLNLPFYETGTVKKRDLTQKDVDIIKALLNEICPHQIYVAGDLADPHGTHKVCLDAVLAAVDELQDERAAWLETCRIWMYRGAWTEWEIDLIEMAVPLSPEELLHKRNAILRHQSQMEGAPFLGNDERLFWQRSEERNKTTADMYNKLGLAAYEAIEAFVQYVPK